MTYILLGILFGWLIPRPKFIGKIEIAIWKPIKKKLPKRLELTQMLSGTQKKLKKKKF